MSWLSIALLACAVLIVAAAEWPRLERRFGKQARIRRDRARRKPDLKLIRTATDDDFAASVERDLARLPTIEEREENGRR